MFPSIFFLLFPIFVVVASFLYIFFYIVNTLQVNDDQHFECHFLKRRQLKGEGEQQVCLAISKNLLKPLFSAHFRAGILCLLNEAQI